MNRRDLPVIAGLPNEPLFPKVLLRLRAVLSRAASTGSCRTMTDRQTQREHTSIKQLTSVSQARQIRLQTERKMLAEQQARLNAGPGMTAWDGVSSLSKPSVNPALTNSSHYQQASDTGLGLSKNSGGEAAISVLGVVSDGVGGLGGGLKEQGGSLRITNGAYNGNALSLKYYESGWAGGSRAQIKTYQLSSVSKVVSKLGTGGAAVVGLYDIGAKLKDEGRFGVQTQLATGRTAGSFAGGYGGATAGATIGAAFGGFGAIPGGIIGALIGGWGGSKAGEKVVETIQN